MRYRDRREAGRVLGEHLAAFAGQPDVVVLGLPRGGIPVAWEVARRVRALRQERAARVIVAVPIAAPSTCAEMEDEADEVICAATPEPFRAVGLWYEDFTQTTDEEVRELLDRSVEGDSASQGGALWT